MFDGSKKAENMMSFQIHNNIVAVTCTKSLYHIYIKGYIFLINHLYQESHICHHLPNAMGQNHFSEQRST